jgi:Tol biopolymer transport system component
LTGFPRSYPGAYAVMISAFLLFGRLSLADEPKQWPAAPPYSETGNILLLPPQATPPPNDPFEPQVVPPSIRGTITYIPIIVPIAHAAGRPYFVMRSVNASRGLSDGIGKKDDSNSPQAPGLTDVVSYYTASNTNINEPQYSPDGSKLLIKLGYLPETYPSYELYIWDLEQGKLKRAIPPRLAYAKVFWARDNRHLAYVVGGDIGGYEATGTGHVQARIGDTNTGKEYSLQPNPGVSDFVWTSQGSLLYTLPPQMQGIDNPTQTTKAKNPKVTGKKISKANPTGPLLTKHRSSPEIYEAGTDGKAKRLISDGYNPVPSPDGKQVVYYRSRSLTDQEAATGTNNFRIDHTASRFRPVYWSGKLLSESKVYLYDRQTKQSVLIRNETPDWVYWTPDGSRLVLITMKGEGQSGPTQYGAYFQVLDIKGTPLSALKDLKARDLAVVTARDVDGAIRGGVNPQYMPQGVSNDGRYFFMFLSELTEKSERFDIYDQMEKRSLSAIDLESGEVVTVAQIEAKVTHVIGWDWHDESLPEPSAAAMPATKQP